MIVPEEEGEEGVPGARPADAGERQRLIAAFTRIAAERGVEATSVELVADGAGLDRDGFLRNFTDLEECLLAAHDDYVARLMAQVRRACGAEPDWPGSVQNAIAAALAFFAEVSGPSRVFMVETMVSGAAAIDRRYAAIEELAAPLRRGRDLYPAAMPMSPATEQALVAGIVMLVSVNLLAEDSEALLQMEPDVVELVLTPYIGAPEARRVASGRI